MDLKNVEIGQKVRLTVDATVSDIDFDGELFLTFDRGEVSLYSDTEDVVSVEAVEEVFGPGDTVKNKDFEGTFVILSETEYFSVTAKQVFSYGSSDTPFTSAVYERVSENFGVAK